MCSVVVVDDLLKLTTRLHDVPLLACILPFTAHEIAPDKIMIASEGCSCPGVWLGRCVREIKEQEAASVAGCGWAGVCERDEGAGGGGAASVPGCGWAGVFERDEGAGGGGAASVSGCAGQECKKERKEQEKSFSCRRMWLGRSAREGGAVGLQLSRAVVGQVCERKEEDILD